MKTATRTKLVATIAALMVTTLVASAAPAMAVVINDGGATASPISFTPKLVADLQVPEVETLVLKAPEKIAVPVESPAPEAEAAAPEVAAEVGKKVTADPVDTSPLEDASYRTSAAEPAKKVGRLGGSSSGATGEQAEAEAILKDLIKQHPILEGSTVSFGDAKGYQAICYYMSGRIVISPSHTASLGTILNHEIWHIIDWRDNGRIDWGENVPPN
jgi:hypothetical protein